MGVTVAQYTMLLQQLLPSGAALDREPQSNLAKLLTGLAEEFARIDARVELLINEMHPSTISDLIDEWEASLGLPDNCVTFDLTITDRRDMIKGRLTATGGASQQYFIDLAASMGFTITIVIPVAQHTWEIHAATETLQAFRAGANVAGDPLRTFGREEILECVMNRFKPAHTALTFVYS